MRPVLTDTIGLGIFFWLIGYIAGIILFFTPVKDILGWILFAVFTPFTLVVTWWWFRKRERLPLQYFGGVGMAWALIAIVLDYLFIVMLFGSSGYYTLHIFLYYALMLLIPVAVGLYQGRIESGAERG